VLLAIDVGNSETSFGLFRDQKLVRTFRLQTQRQHTSDEIASFTLPLLKEQSIESTSLEAVLLCSVVPPVDRAFNEFCSHYLKIKPFIISPKMDLDFKLNVEEPWSVGADRIANTAYAKKLGSLPALIVDFGTATTVDVVSNDYLGGAILPGVKMAFDSLAEKTSQLSQVAMEFPPSVIGRTTAQCLQSGILLGYVDLVEGLLKRTEVELGTSATVYLAGGFANLMAPHLNSHYHLEPDFTLKGIVALWEKTSG